MVVNIYIVHLSGTIYKSKQKLGKHDLWVCDDVILM
jgi:hypothetical protein